MLDNDWKLARASCGDYLEFYIALAPGNGASRPRLTPRLFYLRPDSRLYVSNRAHGRYTLTGTTASNQIVFVATGTGEAPHNAMLTELLAFGHRQPIVSVTCVRRRQDLAYLSVHRELERRFSNYRYLALTTREPEKVDPQMPGYVGKRHLQEYFATGDFERDAGVSLDPGRTHVYLCGNPAMVGLAGRGLHGTALAPTGMAEILQRRGFQLDSANRRGNLHCENFW
jgi:ferredoxin--NADP+ reductase